MIKTLYKKILKPILFLFDAEYVHEMFIKIGNLLGRSRLTRWITGIFFEYKGKDISKVVDGIRYKYPVMLAAGFDYNANLLNILDKVSFGGEEVGSITLRKCEGNPKPRMSRAIKSQSIVVYKGLRNEGADKTIEKLKHSKIDKDYVLGISIARTNDSKAVGLENGINEFYGALKKFHDAGVGQFYTINISCPNAFGGESFAEPESLDKLLKKICTLNVTKPLYVKMPINISWKDYKLLMDIIVKYKMNGVVIGNLNKNYDDLDFRNEAPQKYRGGLSGKPCRKLSTELISKTRKEYGNKITIIGCGGIMSPRDAMEKFEAGADLIQLISGMIFEGPTLMREICKEYSKASTSDSCH